MIWLWNNDRWLPSGVDLWLQDQWMITFSWNCGKAMEVGFIRIFVYSFVCSGPRIVSKDCVQGLCMIKPVNWLLNCCVKKSICRCTFFPRFNYGVLYGYGYRYRLCGKLYDRLYHLDIMHHHLNGSEWILQIGCSVIWIWDMDVGYGYSVDCIAPSPYFPAFSHTYTTYNK